MNYNDDKSAHFSMNRIAKHSSNRCYICGQVFPKQDSCNTSKTAIMVRKVLGMPYGCSRDHLIPRAIFKWLGILYPEYYDDLKSKILKNEYNVLLAHESCNVMAMSTIREPEELDSTIVNKDFIDKYSALYDDCKEYISLYKELINSLLEKQDYKCAICGTHIIFKTCTIRRPNKRIPRSRVNAILVCQKCNWNSH